MFGSPVRWRLASLIAPVTISAAALSMDAAHAQATRVAQIEVVGNNQINKESILAVVSTRPGDDYSPERLERDRRAIEALGWFKVVGPPATTQVPGGIRVTF